MPVSTKNLQECPFRPSEHLGEHPVIPFKPIQNGFAILKKLGKPPLDMEPEKSSLGTRTSSEKNKLADAICGGGLIILTASGCQSQKWGFPFTHQGGDFDHGKIRRPVGAAVVGQKSLSPSAIRRHAPLLETGASKYFGSGTAETARQPNVSKQASGRPEMTKARVQLSKRPEDG